MFVFKSYYRKKYLLDFFKNIIIIWMQNNAFNVFGLSLIQT